MRFIKRHNDTETLRKVEDLKTMTFKDLNGHTYTLGELRKYNGYFKWDGDEYILIQQPYRDTDVCAQMDIFVSYAIKLQDDCDYIDDTIQCYKVVWEMTVDDEDDCFNADWDEPLDVTWQGLYFAKEGRLV